MQSNLHPISDIVIEERITDYKQRLGIWINEHMGHRMVCRCKRCNFGEMKQNGDNSGDFEFPGRCRQIYQQH